MRKSLKAIIIAVGALIGLLVLAATALLLFLTADSYKPRLEVALSDMIGMEVKVGGRLGIGLFPSLLVTLKDVHIRNRGTDVVTAREARVGIDFLTLLRKGFQIKLIALEQPSIFIVRDRDGSYNFNKSGAAPKSLPNLNLEKVFLSDATLIYQNKQTGKGFEADDCNLDMSHLRLSDRNSPGIMKHLAFTAELICGKVRTKHYVASTLKFSVAGQDGVFDLKPLTMQVFSGKGSGNIRADFTGAVPLYHVRYILSQFHIDEFHTTLSPTNVAEGPMDFSASLSMQGETISKLKQTLEGKASLRGKNLILNGRDLDQAFDRYESSQNFNLVDVGAFYFAGPVGLAITKGYNFASILQGSEGRSEIRTIVSDWTVEGGVARSQDVAMATNNHRVALQGGLDFANERFDGVTVALIDAKGCIKVQQAIHGDFKRPVVEKPSTLKSLTGPVVKLLKQVGRLFPGGECEVFYAGSVQAPQ